MFKIGHDDEGSDQDGIHDGKSHLNHGDVIGAVPDGQGVHTQLLFHKADKVAGGEQRVIIILFPGHDVSAPFLERSSPASKDSRALLGEIEEEVLDVGALVQHVDQRLPVHHQRAPAAGYM